MRHADIDPDALGKLPPSVQLAQITAFRDRKTASNRARFRDAAACPVGFSGVQMKSFLEGTAFRAKVDKMRESMNAAAGFGAEGAKPIASLTGRSFIFKDAADGALLMRSVTV